jgi:hypothetical protein
VPEPAGAFELITVMTEVGYGPTLVTGPDGFEVYPAGGVGTEYPAGGLEPAGAGTDEAGGYAGPVLPGLRAVGVEEPLGTGTPGTDEPPTGPA